MDLTTQLLLMNLVTLNIPNNTMPMTNEMRLQASANLADHIYKTNLDHQSFPNESLPLEVLTVLNVQNLFEIDEDGGTIRMNLGFNFKWIDKRLSWNPEDYSGLASISSLQHPELEMEIVYLDILTSDLTYSATDAHLMDREHDLMITSDGVVTVHVRIIIRTTCQFAFGDYPYDYQNCTFVLHSPHNGNEFVFSEMSQGTSVLLLEKEVTHVQDYKLIGVVTETYYLYFGNRVIDIKSKAGCKSEYCQSILRYTLMLKRAAHYHLIFMSLPQASICMMLGFSLVYHYYFSTTILVPALGIQLYHIYRLANMLPSDYDGTPMIANIACWTFFNLAILVFWRFICTEVQCDHPEQFPWTVPGGKVRHQSKLVKFFLITDKILMYFVCTEAVLFIYLAMTH